jgi:hypothetical protein
MSNQNLINYDLSSEEDHVNKPYDMRVTASISSIDVQGNGPLVRIYGTGFSQDITDVSVKFGELPC